MLILAKHVFGLGCVSQRQICIGLAISKLGQTTLKFHLVSSKFDQWMLHGQISKRHSLIVSNKIKLGRETPTNGHITVPAWLFYFAPKEHTRFAQISREAPSMINHIPVPACQSKPTLGQRSRDADWRHTFSGCVKQVR